MLQLSPNTKIYICLESVDFRKGIQSLSGVIRGALNSDPLSGHLFLFRNSRHNSLKAIVYDGQGIWMCMKRLSQGTYKWWPSDTQEAQSLSYAQLWVLLNNGDPMAANFQKGWRPPGVDTPEHFESVMDFELQA